MDSFSWILIACVAGSTYGQFFNQLYPQQQQGYPYGQYGQSGTYGSYPYYGDVFRRINSYFVRQYISAQAFYAVSRQDLDRKVQDAADLLNQIRLNLNDMTMAARAMGDTVLQNALSRVDADTQDIGTFQRQLWMDRTTPFPQLEAQWQGMITTIYDNGLYSIMRAADIALSGSPTLHHSIFLWICTFLATGLLVVGLV